MPCTASCWLRTRQIRASKAASFSLHQVCHRKTDTKLIKAQALLPASCPNTSSPLHSLTFASFPRPKPCRLVLFAPLFFFFFFPFTDFHLFVDIFLILGGVFLRRQFHRHLLPLGEEDARGVVIVIFYCVLVVCSRPVSDHHSLKDGWDCGRREREKKKTYTWAR